MTKRIFKLDSRTLGNSAITSVSAAKNKNKLAGSSIADIEALAVRPHQYDPSPRKLRTAVSDQFPEYSIKYDTF
jgi:hypothetical protein